MDDTEQNKLATEAKGEETTGDSMNKDTAASAEPAPADTSAGQNDTKKPEDADPEPEIKQPEGPGPKPLETVAKEHGGDAGNIEGAAAETSQGGDKPAGAADGDDAGDESKAAHDKDEGTGEKYVKTSGLAADGGDFDATKPGAGREADRLMDQKGMHPYDKKESSDPSAKPDTKDPAEKKPSLLDRMKAKMHKN